jgi:hypothetical protein
MSKQQENPFQITSPEGLTAEETVSLFVDVFTDFPKIKDQGHAFLVGPRGIGKSMMFRYLQADCQCLVEKCSFSNVPFLGIYIPIKNESFVKTEFKRLESHANEIFNENLMVLHMGIKVFDSILKNTNAINCVNSDSLFSYYQDIFLPLAYFNTVNKKINDENYTTDDILKNIIKEMMSFYRIASNYSKNLSFSTDLPAYTGPLFDYQDFLFPLLSELVNIDGFPSGTIYLLIDDAHILSLTQTRILNSWIATRTSKGVSLKVSSEYNYKSYYTVMGSTIDSPHDYYEVDMSTVYTGAGRKSNYKDRIKNIVNRRLELSGIKVSADDFFPCDFEQEKKIEEIAEKYKKMHDEGKGKGYYRSDDALRYARPDFIKSLAGTSKSSSTYSYAGFEQLVHLSSGIVRYFLESAHQMFSNEISLNNNKKILFISPKIQDVIVRTAASDALLYEMDRYKKEGDPNAIPKEDLDKLSNLVHGLGGLFRQILLSNRSERRVFSIAISDDLSESVEKILNIGVNLGFFHRSTIGRKNRKSGGRTKLFVLNRRLAPNWNLDPTGFAGYLFVQNSILEEGIENPQKMLSRIEKNRELENLDVVQLNLFNEEEIEEPFLVLGGDDE